MTPGYLTGFVCTCEQTTVHEQLLRGARFNNKRRALVWTTSSTSGGRRSSKLHQQRQIHVDAPNSTSRSMGYRPRGKVGRSAESQVGRVNWRTTKRPPLWARAVMRSDGTATIIHETSVSIGRFIGTTETSSWSLLWAIWWLHCEYLAPVPLAAPCRRLHHCET
jgi:hypothetical protein